MRYVLNTPGPHRRDINRFMAAAEKRFRAETNREDDNCLEVSDDMASTGSVYVTVCISVDVPDGDFEVVERVYRFAAHPRIFEPNSSSHNFSVYSGGKAAADKKRKALPPGYDGWTNDAIKDVQQWLLTPRIAKLFDLACQQRWC